jgi:hypothetical protein
MANISSSFGTITLQGDWTDEQIKWYHIFIIGLGHGYYNTIVEMDLEDIIKEKTMYFVGNGRWVYMSNLESMHNWIKNISIDTIEFINNFGGLDQTITHAEYNLMYAWLLKEMNEHDLTVEWEYTDIEGGLGVLQTVCGVQTSTGTELLFTTTSEQHYEYNLKNLFEIGQEDGITEDAIVKICKILDYDRNQLWDLLQTDPNWFDLQPFIYSIEDIPERLIKKVHDSKRIC